MELNEQKKQRIIVGRVVSDKMDKTIVVRVDRAFMHPVFHKVMRTNKKYKVHDEREEASIGDMVEFNEGKPLSKTKYMYLVRVVKAGQ